MMKLKFSAIQRIQSNQLNHEFAINNDELRSLAREAWSLIANFSNLTLTWIPRSKNLAGKMLGS